MYFFICKLICQKKYSMSKLKIFFKRNTHNFFFKTLAGFGRSMNRLYENRNIEPYSNGELTIIKKISSINPQIIIDGGANVGKYSQIIYNYIKNCKIYAFEPVEKTFNILSDNVKNIDTIILLKIGLFNKNCTKIINIYKQHSHSSIFDLEEQNQKSIDKISIELIKGDDFMKENNIKYIDFLKLDLEGADFDALEGFEENIKNKKIRLIQFEYGYISITTKKLLIDFYKFFAKHDYIVGKIYPKKVEFREYKLKHEDFLGPNYVAVHKDDIEIINLLTK